MSEIKESVEIDKPPEEVLRISTTSSGTANGRRTSSTSSG
jgi:hypothetical protein